MMEGFGKRIKKVLGTGVLAGASLLSSEGAQASQLNVARAQTAVNVAQFDFDHATKSEKKIEAERKLELAKGKLAEAKAKNLDEVEKMTQRQESQKSAMEAKKAEKENFFSKNSAEKTVAFRQVDVLDTNGGKIGTAMEGSKEWKKLEEKRIAANRAIEKEKAKASRPTIVVDSGMIGPTRNWGHGGVNTDTRDGGYVTPYDSTGGRNQPRRNR